MNHSFPDDELAKIWANDPVPGRKAREEVMAIVTQRRRRFEKNIRVRDWQEIIAAAIVGVFFLWAALHSQGLLQRAGHWIIVASSVWIIYYLRTHQFRHIPSDPALNMQSYTKELLSEYEKQIRLLKRVKYWYLLPLYLGLMVGWAGTLQLDGKGGLMKSALSAFFITGLFGAIWWLNEVWAVRRVSAERDKIRALIPERDEPD